MDCHLPDALYISDVILHIWWLHSRLEISNKSYSFIQAWESHTPGMNSSFSWGLIHLIVFISFSYLSIKWYRWWSYTFHHYDIYFSWSYTSLMNVLILLWSHILLVTEINREIFPPLSSRTNDNASLVERTHYERQHLFRKCSITVPLSFNIETGQSATDGEHE